MILQTIEHPSARPGESVLNVLTRIISMHYLLLTDAPTDLL